MRIVGGSWRGRPLQGPTNATVRPTSDRLRESMFNIIEHSYGGVDGKFVIDLFAGTGAFALEALSRGAIHALLVDSGSEARTVIRANIEALGAGGLVRVFRRDACALGTAPAGTRFNVAFLDPPYLKGLAEPALLSLHAGQWLDSEALVVVEENERVVVNPQNYAVLERRSFGDTALTFLRPAPTS